jgi:hypothetical protein
MKPRIGRAITTPRFTPLAELALGVGRDMEEGRRVSVKIRDGEMSNAEPTVALKWQLYRMDSRTGIWLVTAFALSALRNYVQLARNTWPPVVPGFTASEVKL